jgi:hypothetical protein
MFSHSERGPIGPCPEIASWAGVGVGAGSGVVEQCGDDAGCALVRWPDGGLVVFAVRLIIEG